ncbi:exonuclease domain-containing protein [Escherichia coli]|nr:exonuclease domain-containing protein [Escherichia coli]
MKASGCNRAIMVAHNANFDHSFMMAAAERASLKRNPFHRFRRSTLLHLPGWHSDKPYCQRLAQTGWHGLRQHQAHSALYDTERTAVLFCEIVNRWKRLGGWPLPAAEEV